MQRSCPFQVPDLLISLSRLRLDLSFLHLNGSRDVNRKNEADFFFCLALPVRIHVGMYLLLSAGSGGGGGDAAGHGGVRWCAALPAPSLARCCVFSFAVVFVFCFPCPERRLRWSQFARGETKKKESGASTLVCFFFFCWCRPL